MKVYHKIFLIIVTCVCMIFFSRGIFARNTDDLKSDIYHKLRDRRCSDMILAECNCPDAREMKAYIDALIEVGVSKEDIFYKVAKKFSINTILDEKIKADVEKRLVKEAGEKYPRIALEPTAFDFGQVSRKQGRIGKTFKLSNKGNSSLIIKHIRTSCPCTVVSLNLDKNKSPYFGTAGTPKEWQAEIKPGETGELEVVLDLTDPHVKTGRLIREALIISNDPVYPEVTGRIEAEVKD